MKIFRYELGHEAGKTMTVSELIKKLHEYPDEMPVFGAWEGCTGFIEETSFAIEKVSKGKTEDECDCLTIDVEHY